MRASDKCISDWKELGKLGSIYRNNDDIVVLTFGAYDILHAGHLLYLEQARSFGTVLVVGITNDQEIRRVKGSGRPINSEAERALVIAGFECVNRVFIFDSDDCRMIRTLRPRICVYSETSEKKMEERDAERRLIERFGGRLVCLPAASNRHSTDIIQSLRIAAS